MIDALALARMLGTTPSAIAGLMGSVPTRPADVRRLARRLGIDYESLRTFADGALAPFTGFDAETQLMLRLWQKLDPKRRQTALAVLADMASARRKRVPRRK
jgi:xanthine/CO dehydrogenase XdhC/CoxF family maturation factor